MLRAEVVRKSVLYIASLIVYVDVDIAYGSPNYGNIHEHQKSLMPPNIRNVTYVNAVDGGRVKELIKRSVQYPKSCAKL
jgi:hypothetical protein